MAICKTCNKEMYSHKSCKKRYIVINETQRIEKVPFGKEQRFKNKIESKTCPDCEVAIGGIHHTMCDVEECPICNKQYITCKCNTVGQSETVDSEIDYDSSE